MACSCFPFDAIFMATIELTTSTPVPKHKSHGPLKPLLLVTETSQPLRSLASAEGKHFAQSQNQVNVFANTRRFVKYRFDVVIALCPSSAGDESDRRRE
jgi:hypothetical protein